jgi:excisionase family DNA binding protein
MRNMSKIEPRLLKIGEAAKVLNTSARFVEERVRTGALPSVRLGRLRRIHAEVLEEYSRFGQVAEDRRVSDVGMNIGD